MLLPAHFLGRAKLKIEERDWKHLVKTTTAAVETA